MNKGEKQLKIKKISKKGQLFAVYFDTVNCPFYVNEDVIVKYRLIKNTYVDISIVKKLELEELLSRAYNDSIKYITYQLRTSKMVIDRLKKKNYDEDTIFYVIDKLTTLKYLDDELYLNTFFKELLNKKYGPKKIEYLIRKKGFSQVKVKELISAISYTKFIENGICIIKSEQKKLINYPIMYQKSKAYQVLNTYGYNSEMIEDIISRLEFIDNSIEYLPLLVNKLKQKNLSNESIIHKLTNLGYSYSDIINVIDE